VIEIVPEVSVLMPYEPEDACSYCTRPDGAPVRKAKHSRSVTYKVNGSKIAFIFSMCDLCEFARRVFPAFDSRIQALRLQATIVRLHERYS